MSVSDIELHADLRGAVKELCQHFPDSYWRDLDREQSYPEEFVKTLSDAGYLSALIPEDFGGSGLGIAEASIILEELRQSAAGREQGFGCAWCWCWWGWCELDQQ